MHFPIPDGSTLLARRKRDGQPLIEYRLMRAGALVTEGEVEVKLPRPLGLAGRDYILEHIKETANVS
jgi:hypothetical protein